MMKINNKILILICLCMIGLLLLIGGLSCCTITTQDRNYEVMIQNFVDNAIPGSEIELLNGDSLGGWSVHGIGSWSVDNGVLSIRRGLGYLATTCESFTNFELSLESRISSYGNSGIYFRADHPGFSIRPWPQGYEAQIDHHTEKNPTGSIYNIKKNSADIPNDNEWFTMKIIAINENIKVFVNGQLSAEVSDASYTSGFIALQAHDPWSVVEFRNIRLRFPDDV